MDQPQSKPAEPLPRSVVLLGWVSFFADVSSEMIYPLLPLFIVGVLAAPATTLGGIEGLAQAAVAVLTAISGWRSDRLRRRVVFVRWGYGLPVIGKGLLAVATMWPMVLLARGIDRTGKGLRSSPRDALIADAIGADQRGRAFGFHRAMDTAGALIGVLLSAALMAWLFGWGEGASPADSAWAFRVVFAIAAGLALCSLALTFVLKESQPVSPPHVEAAGPAEPASSSTERFSPRFWLVLAMLVVFALANSSDTFLLLRAGQVGLSPVAVVLAYAVFNLSYALFSYPAGALSDRLDRWKIIGLGWGIYSAVYAGFAVTGPGGVWPLMALYGGYMALTEGVGKALIADHAPPQRRATAMGILYLSLGLAALVSSLLAGWMWDHLSPSAPFWFGSAAAGGALIMLVVMHPRLRAPTS